jgi:hypothetical protein
MSFFSHFAGVLLERLFHANDIPLLEDKSIFTLLGASAQMRELSASHNYIPRN